MEALIVLDVQNGFIKGNDEIVSRIKKLANHFKNEGNKVIAFKHIDKTKGSLIEYGTSESELPSGLNSLVSEVIQKEYPIAFKETELQQYLEDNKIDKLYIIGFNIEFCVLFTSVAAADRGYEVIVLEDLCGTVNDEDTYEMDGLDIIDFVGSVIDWSGVIKNEYLEESKFSNLGL